MKKSMILSLVVLVGLAGCGGRKKKKTEKVKSEQTTVALAKDAVNIPLADNDTRDFILDDNLDEFALLDDMTSEYASADVASDLDFNSELSWIEDAPVSKEFKNVYFEFDSYEIRKDQEETVKYNIEMVQRLLEENTLFGDLHNQPVVIINANSDHAAGTKVYNLALSEARGKVLAEKFVAAGIPRESVKIVAHGSEVPAVVNGQIVTGDKDQQWPNRRDEIVITYS